MKAVLLWVKVYATDDSSIIGGKITRRTWTLSNGDTQEGLLFSTRLDPGKYLLSLEVETDQGTTAIAYAAFDVAAKYRNDEIASSVNTTIAGYNSSAFNPIALTLSVSFDGEGIDLNRAIDITSDYTSLVTATTKTSANEIVIGINALDGLNDLVLSAFDKSGHYIQKRISFLAGSRTITVDVLDGMSNQVTAGSFKAVHTKANTELAITTVTSNQFVVNNAPADDLYLYFIKTDGDFAGKRISSTDTDVDLNLRGFSTISTTANPDLSHGSTGWTFNSNYVTLVQVGGENRFQIDMEQGESTEYSHALIASQRYLSYPIQLEGNIIDAHTNIILRNYTQDTVSVRSLSPQDLGFNTLGESFDIFEGYVSIEAATGDQLEIIVQITAPAASLQGITRDSRLGEKERSISVLRGKRKGGIFWICKLGVKFYDIYREAEKEIKRKDEEGNEITVKLPRGIIAEPLKYLSLGSYELGRERDKHSSVLYTLPDDKVSYCQVRSIALRVKGGPSKTSNPATIMQSRPWSSDNYRIKVFEFFDTSGLLGSDTIPQKDVKIFVTFGSDFRKWDVGTVSAKNILKQYASSNAIHIGSSDDNKYDRRDQWVGKIGKIFLDKVFTKYGERDDNKERKIKEIFKINDISNINGGTFPPHAGHQGGLDIDFIIVKGFLNDRKFSFKEFEVIRQFVERGVGSSESGDVGYEPYIKNRGIIASQNLTGGKDSFVNYSCINSKPATNYIVNDDEAKKKFQHFNHWHLDVSAPNGTARYLNKEKERNMPIQYETAIEDGPEGNKVLVIKLPTEMGAIYSFLLAKSDSNFSPNSDDHSNSFTKGGGNMMTGSIVEDNKTFTYTLKPMDSNNPQIRITTPAGEGDISAFDSLSKYKIRVNKFYVRSSRPDINLYTKENFTGATSCLSRDIDIGVLHIATCGDNKEKIVFKRVNKEVGGRKFSYLIENGLKIDEEFFLPEKGNIIRTSSATEDYLNDYNKMVRICGKSTSLTGSRVLIWNSAQLNNVVVRGNRDRVIDIAGQAVIHNADIDSSQGKVEVDGESRIIGHPENFIKLRGGRNFGLLIREATVNTSSSNMDSMVSGNLIIYYGSVTGRNNINADAAESGHWSNIQGRIVSTAMGMNTITGIFRIGSYILITDSTIHGGTPIVDCNGGTDFLAIEAGKRHRVTPISNSTLSGVFRVLRYSSIAGSNITLQSTPRHHSIVRGRISGITLGQGVGTLSDGTFTAAASAFEACSSASRKLSQGLFFDADEDEYLKIMKLSQDGILRRKMLEKEEEARKRRRVRQAKNH